MTDCKQLKMSQKLSIKIKAAEATKIINWEQKKFVTVANLKDNIGKQVFSKFLNEKLKTTFGVKFTVGNGHYWKKKVSWYVKCPCETKFTAETKGYTMKEGADLFFDIHRPELVNDKCKCCMYSFLMILMPF